MTNQTAARKSAVGSVRKALILLEALALEKSPVGVSDLSRRVEFDKATAFRMLRTLEEYGYVVKNARFGKYSLGYKVLDLGRACLGKSTLQAKARPFLEDLMRKSGETVFLGVLQNDGVFYLDAVESHDALRMTAPTFGQRAPLHCSGLGKVILAFLPDPACEELCSKIEYRKFTPRTVSSAKELREELAVIRRQGYAVDDKEIGEDSRCVAAPIRDNTGHLHGAVSLSGPASRLTLAKIREIAPTLIAAANAIAQSLTNENGFGKAQG